MPTLNWIGKEKVINHHQQVPYHLLKHKYGFSQDTGETSAPTGSGNMIIHGDNLIALKSLLPMYEGRVNCVYIDPPYNTGNEGWVYNDNVNDPRILKWLGEVVGKEGEDFSRHDKWLCMMYPRLVLLKKLLADDGAIFISIDDNEQANLKLICDEIFGDNNFVTDLIWRSSDSSNHDAKLFSVDYNHTLIYSKSSVWHPNKLKRKDSDNLHYKNPDNDPRGPWFSGNLSSPNPRVNLQYDITSPKGIIIHSPKNGWRWSKERMQAMIDNKEVIFSDDETRIIKKTFLKDQPGLVPSNIWWDIEDTGHNRNAKYELKKIFNELRTSDVFKTPKPTKFIDKILQLFKDEDMLVLDSFAGSGTTAHAVLSKNKEDGGNRKFILVEMGDYANTTTAERVKRVINGYGTGNNAVPGTGGSFDFYELGESLYDANGNLNEKAGEDAIREYIYYTETRQQLSRQRSDEERYLLDVYADTAYYFYYEPDELTTLRRETLDIVKQKAEQYIIYADVCLLDDDFKKRNNIIFKKIPRDIKHF